MARNVPILSSQRLPIQRAALKSPTRALGVGESDPHHEVKDAKGAIRVDNSKMQLVQICTRVIQDIKAKYLPRGAGNVRESIEGSGGMASVLLTAFRNMHYQRKGGEWVEVGQMQLGTGTGKSNVIRNAVSAAIIGGGNCLQHASIAFVLLLERLPQDTVVDLVQSSWDHAFCLVNDEIVVDAWPHVAQVCLLDQSHFKPSKLTVVCREKAGYRQKNLDQKVLAQKGKLEAFLKKGNFDRDERKIKRNLTEAFAAKTNVEKGTAIGVYPTKNEKGIYDQLTALQDDTAVNLSL